MIAVLLYLLFFASWFFYNKKKYGYNASSLLIGLYLASNLALFFLCSIGYNDYSFEKVYLDATIYHVITLWLFMMPVVRVGNKLDVRNLVISDNLLSQVSLTLIVIGCLTILLSIPGIKAVLSFDTFEGAREAAIWGDEFKGFYSYGLIGYVATIGMITPAFAIFVAFYRLFIQKKADSIFYLLMITSTSGGIMNLTIAGRDGLVRWFMFVILNIAIYRKQFNIKIIPNFIKVSFLALTFATIAFFIVITLSRFGEENAQLSIVDYLGMSSLWFSELYKGVGTDYLFGFSSIFPILPGGMNSLDIAKMNLNFSTSSFHTFVGTFVLDVGTFFTFIMAILFNVIYSTVSRSRNCKLHNFFSFLIFYQIIYIGVFYFVYALLAWQCSFLIIYIISKKIYLKKLNIVR